MASEASVVEQTVVETMQNIVSEDTDKANESCLSQLGEVKGNYEEEKIIVEDLANVHAAKPEPEGNDKSVSQPLIEAEDDSLKEKTDAPNDIQPSYEPVVERHEDVSEKYITEDSVQTPNEPVLSETSGEGNSVQESTEASAVGQESAHDATAVFDSNEESPTSGESTYGAIEVSPESSKEEAPQSGIPEPILDQIAEVVSTESNVLTSNTIPTTEVAELAKEEIDVKGENKEKNTDVKETASTETINEPVAEQHEEVLEKSITEDLVQTPKESALSETVCEDSVQESSETSTLDQESAHDATLILNSNGTEENPTGGESTFSVIPTELKEQTVTSELSTQKTDDDLNAGPGIEETTEEDDKLVVSTESNVEITNTTPTTEVAEVAKLANEEIDVTEENGEGNIDGKKTACTETTQIVANNGSEEAVKASEGVELIDQVKNENLEGETTRDVEVVQVENKVSNDPQSDSKESETEVKSVTKQTLLEKFATENTEEGKQETPQIGDRSIEVTTKDDGATKTDQETDKAEISSKKSRSVMSKVKQSIAKVKKAIIGKSPSSKTMTPEGIDDAKAK